METLTKKITITKSDQERLQIYFLKNQNNHEIKNNIKIVAEKLNIKAVDPQNIAPTVVTMNSKVKVKNLLLKKSFTLQLVYPDAVDVNNNKISIFSPLGASMFGYSQGDEFEMIGGNGRNKFLIEEVLYQPEATGDFN
jgi:regulator of nucleoside diphosphate kinase